jgi:chromosome segregation ATPase
MLKSQSGDLVGQL